MSTWRFYALLLDANLADHWPDAALAALIAFGFWLVKLFVSSSLERMEKRHQRAEDNFLDHSNRLVRIETQVDVGKKLDRLAEAMERERR